MSHSKRNTSLAFFTSYERSLLRNSWGSQSTRLTRDSFLPFASCRLCLLAARDPVACTGGLKADIFCRECALNDLVAQRKEIKRLEREWEDREVDKEEQERLNKEEETRKEVEKFERTAQGLEVNWVIAGSSKRKRKADELESAEISGSHKLKTDDGKVHCSKVPACMAWRHLLMFYSMDRPRLPSGFPA
jgi:nitric oxide synthase-interacting protein